MPGPDDLWDHQEQEPVQEEDPAFRTWSDLFPYLLSEEPPETEPESSQPRLMCEPEPEVRPGLGESALVFLPKAHEPHKCVPRLWADAEAEPVDTIRQCTACERYWIKQQGEYGANYVPVRWWHFAARARIAEYEQRGHL